ncbi:MAG: hypothetical protein KC586_27130, partial [Myxococcales bacterium]|nr:hypothetical protein [Myxococcales bacterium]
VWTDPTDLVALPTLAVAWWRFEREAAPQSVARVGWHERLAIALGGLACIATSPAPFPITLAPPSRGEVQITGLYAETYEDESALRENIRVRTLLPSVELDCARLAENPRRAVTRRLFERAELWSLGHRETISRTTTRECDVLWLEHDEAGVVLVTWTADDAVRIALERNGDAIGWVEEIGVRHLSRGVPRAPIPGRECVGLEAPPTLSRAWPNDSPTGLYELAVASSPDGCTELTFTPVLDMPVEPFDPTVEEPPVEEPPVEEPMDPMDGPPADEPMDPMDGPPLPPEDEPVPPLEPTVTRLFACGYPAEAFAVFDGPVRLDTTTGAVRWVQEAVDG